MRRYINLDNLWLQTQQAVSQAAANLTGKRGDTPTLDLIFVDQYGNIKELDPGGSPALTSFKFGAKLHDDFDFGYTVSNWNGAAFAFTKTGGSIFTDAVLNSTATLISATAGFLPSDAGLALAGAGIPANTTILSVQSANSVTLSANATATGGGVTITITGRTPIYTVNPGLNTRPLGDAFIDGTVSQTVANQAALFALVGLTNGTIVYESDNATYWIVVDNTNLGNNNGWGPAPEIESVTLDCEITWVLGGQITSTLTFPLLIWNDVNQGNEGQSPAPEPSWMLPSNYLNYFPAVTGLVGGGSTNLDGQATVNLPVLTLVAVVIGGAEKHYQLQTGAAGAGDIAPVDYNAGTNNKKWVSVL